MKFNILDYSQRISISLGLDLKDLHILGWIQDFWPRMNKMIIKGEEYGWINYQSLIEDMPILEIKTKKALYRRLKSLEEVGLLKHEGVKNKKGSFSYYKITEKICELLDDKPSGGGGTEKSHGGTEKGKGVVSKSNTKDYPTKLNYSTISSSSNSPTLNDLKKYKEEKEYLSDVEEFFKINESYGWEHKGKKIKNRYVWYDRFEENYKKSQPKEIEVKTKENEQQILSSMIGKLKRSFPFHNGIIDWKEFEDFEFSIEKGKLKIDCKDNLKRIKKEYGEVLKESCDFVLLN